VTTRFFSRFSPKILLANTFSGFLAKSVK
jgi:hypothetical protein